MNPEKKETPGRGGRKKEGRNRHVGVLEIPVAAALQRDPVALMEHALPNCRPSFSGSTARMLACTSRTAAQEQPPDSMSVVSALYFDYGRTTTRIGLSACLAMFHLPVPWPGDGRVRSRRHVQVC